MHAVLTFIELKMKYLPFVISRSINFQSALPVNSIGSHAVIFLCHSYSCINMICRILHFFLVETRLSYDSFCLLFNFLLKTMECVPFVKVKFRKQNCKQNCTDITLFISRNYFIHERELCLWYDFGKMLGIHFEMIIKWSIEVRFSENLPLKQHFLARIA